MKKFKIFSIYLLTLSLMLFGGKSLKAQYDNSLFGLKGVIQNNINNPSFIPEYNMHFGAPFLSSTYNGYGSSGFIYQDIFKVRSDDSLILDNKNFLAALGNKNNLHLNSATQILNAGYKWKDFYFNFAVSEIVDFSFNYPKELVELALYGNGNFIGETVDLSDTYIKFLHYREYALGAAWKMDDQWSFGVKAKLLFGKAGFNTKHLDATLTTTENSFYLTNTTNIEVNSSMPEAWFDDSLEISKSEYMIYGGNFGLGFDLGATYVYDSKLTFAASVLDLGYIQYDRFLKNYTNSNVTWSFEGIDLWDYEGMDSAQIDEKMNAFGDSLIDQFNVTETSEKFNVMLTAKIYLSADYKLSDIENLGLVFRSEFLNNVYRPAITACYSRKFDKSFSAMASYTIASRSYFNLGLGVMYTIDPVQMYFSTDNFIGIFVPDLYKTANYHLGVNIYIPQKSRGRSLID